MKLGHKLLLFSIGLAIFSGLVLQYDLFGSKFSTILPMAIYTHVILYFKEPIIQSQPVEWKPSSFRTKGGGMDTMPNIVLILVDDLGFNDLSGGCGIATPNIDSIRQNGISFTNAYSGQATCAPSRAALLTGRFPTRFGYEFTPGPKELSRILTIPNPTELFHPILHKDLLDVIPPMSEMVVPLNETMFSNVLQEGGYDTYYIGKWDCGPHAGYRAFERGFNESLAFNLGAAPYLPDGHPDLVNGYGTALDDFLRLVLRFHIEHNGDTRMKPDKYMTDYLTEHAVNLIQTRAVKNGEPQQSDPFFLSLAYNAPHNPYQAQRSDYEDPEVQKLPTQMGRVYAAMMKALDRGVGKVLQSLKDANLNDNTIVIFTSDNGGTHYAGFPQANKPFRGWKGTLFEGGIHVPMFMQWPKAIPAPADCSWEGQEGVKPCEQLLVESTVAHVDFLTSFASLVRTTEEARSVPLAKGVQLDGINIFDLVHSAVNKRAQALGAAEHLTPSVAVDSEADLARQKRTERQSQTRTLYWRSGHYSAVRVGDWKLQIALRPNKVWFFNLRADPTEHRNLALEVNVTTQESLQDLLAAQVSVLGDNDADGDVNGDSEVSFSAEFIAQQLQRIHGKWVETNSQQVPPRWPAASETPVTIDKVFQEKQEPGDEYVHWPN